MLKKRFSILQTIIIVLLTFGITCSVMYFTMPKSNLSKKLYEIESIINNNFDGEINEKDIDKAVFSAFVNSLDDKYASYVSKNDSNEYLSNYKKESSGVGINYITSKKGNLLVVAVHENSPADKGGFKVFDEIIAADKLTIKKDGYIKLIEYLQDIKDGTTVGFTVLRNNKNINIKATFGPFEKQTVFYQNVDNIGYIKITHFDDSTLNSFKLALNNLQAKKVKGLLFDVRNNGGGTVDSVCECLDILLPKCDLISVKYKNQKEKVLHKSDNNEINLPMAVLTNGGTASASELFAISLKEMKNAKIIGSKTYGKAKMQTLFNLKDGSVLKITVAKFYSPKKQNWDEKGITPDIKISLKEGQSIYTLTPKTDPVIIKGIKTLKAGE